MKRKYYYHHDFYSVPSDHSLSIIKNFKTYQQEKDYTCGPACLLMLTRFFGDNQFDEKSIAMIVNCTSPEGTSPKEVIKFLLNNNYKIQASINKSGKSKKTFKKFSDFKKFIIENIKKRHPVLVENCDYGGHYKIIIGYDEVSKNEKEDILIFADPADDNDGKIDGYNYFPAYRFFEMWFDDKRNLNQFFIVVKSRNRSKS